jgi:putative peptidoglycan lipid II flippase
MHEAAYLLALFAFGSQLLALVRDRLLASAFGAGHTLDLYYAGFRIPDFLFATVASLFSLYALLPILSRLEREGSGSMNSFLRDVLWVFLAGMGVVSAVIYLFVPAFVPYIAPGFAADPASKAQLIMLVRVLLLQPILLGASNTIAALTQLRHRFVLYSVSPLLYNLGIIFGAVVLYPRFGLAGLGWGVVLGALMHLCIQMPFFLAEPRGEKLPLKRMLKGVWEVLTLSLPRTFALAATQISLVALTAIASYLASGSIAVFMFAYNLQAVPLTIIGVSYSVAAFPTFARLYAQGEHGEFARYTETALRHILFWSVPATVFIIVMRAQIVRVILGAGQFDWNATRLTAAALALFILSLTAQSVTLLIMRAYYAAGETKKPLYRGIADIIVSVGSALALVALFRNSELARDFIESLLRVSDIPGTTVLMLALGYSCGALAQCVLSLGIFARDFKVPYGGLWRLLFESLGAALIGGAVSYSLLSLSGSAQEVNTALGVFAQGATAGFSGLVVTAGVLYVLKNQEFAEALGALRRKFSDIASVVAVEPSDVA